MNTQESAPLLGHLSLSIEAGEFLTERRIQLLEAIEAHGSLLRAAKSLPLSYKAAWYAIERMNALAGLPLVQRRKGGRRGGGTELTERGRTLVAVYRAVEKECQNAIDDLQLSLQAGARPINLRYMLHRRSLAPTGRCPRS